MKVLVTGGAGFIGSNFIHYMLAKYPDYRIVNVDKLTYAGNLANLKSVESDKRYRFVKGDICDARLMAALAKEVDVIVNFAAESHVDRSIDNPYAFLDTNIKGTYSLIQAAREAKHTKFVQISTDEVYGDMHGSNKAVETSPLQPSSPYSAAKAAADMVVLASHRTYGFGGMITRCTNNYGPYQYPEKIVPLFITNALEGKSLPVYGDGKQVRDWLFVDDHCSAIDLVLHQGKPGEVYNVGAEQNPEVTNIELTRQIIAGTNAAENIIQYVTDRPGHDVRYAVDSSKLRAMGWKPSVDFAEGLRRTIDWYKANEAWWRTIKSGEYKQWYNKHYGG